MKAKQYDAIRTTVTVESDAQNGVTYPPGTDGTVVEAYERPAEGYAVDLVIPGIAATRRYDHVVLTPEQFEVTERSGEPVVRVTKPGTKKPLATRRGYRGKEAGH